MALWPAAAICAAGICAVSSAALTNCVVRAVESQYRVVPETNPDPVTVSVNAALPALTYAGEMLAKAGTGLASATTTW